MTSECPVPAAPGGARAGKGRIYLNNAATSWPKAPGVAEAVRAVIEEQPGSHGRSAGRGPDRVAACRARLAELLGEADPSRVVLTGNSTQALNLAILGAPLRAGAGVVTTVTEHNSVLRPLRRLEAAGRIRLHLAGIDPGGAVDLSRFERLLALEPALVVLNHASNVTGRIQDAARLLGMARRAGALTLLDASQSLGEVPVRPGETGADMVAFTGHKALRGPAGTGGLWVAPRVDLEQVLVGGTGVRSDLPAHPPEMPMRLEAGTPNLPGIAGLEAAVSFVLREGEALSRRGDELAARLREGLRAIPGVRLFGGGPRAPHTAVVSFRVAGWSVEEAGYVLEESFGIACRAGLHCAPLIHGAIGSAPEGTIRLSASGCNTGEEIDAAIAAVGSLAACA